MSFQGLDGQVYVIDCGWITYPLVQRTW